MEYIFYYESYGKHKYTVKADNFRIARSKFFEIIKDLRYANLEAVHEYDNEGNWVRKLELF